MKPRVQSSLRAAVAAAAVVGAAGAAHAQDQIRVVGSSTVYPFSSYVAEEFGATTDYSTPVVESTGSGGGFKLFCQGVGEDTPDVTNASRRMKPSELKMCQDNGVEDITENVIGADGIVFAQSKQDDSINLSREQLTRPAAGMPAMLQQDGCLVITASRIANVRPREEQGGEGRIERSGSRDAVPQPVSPICAATPPPPANEPLAASRIRAPFTR